MVLSLPMTAFVGVDDDGDGKLSGGELRIHQADLLAQVQRGLALRDENGARPLHGVLLNLAAPDKSPSAPADQLVVIGQFTLEAQAKALSFSLNLYGRFPAEQAVQIKISRGPQSQLIILTPERRDRALFPSAIAVFTDYLLIGANHILTGTDHLLFLLVILAASKGWRQIVLTLTCFTLGHTITLVASLWGALAVSATIVEPAIAATIVGTALFDWHMRRKRVDVPLPLRLGLVLLCALIHGLGLASSLAELGLDDAHRLLSLSGFNVGIELGQLAIAALGSAVFLAVVRIWGRTREALVLNLVSVFATLMGSIWLIERIAAA